MAAVVPISQRSFWARSKKQPPVRQPNAASRKREYLFPDEIERLIRAARKAGGRLAQRDALLIMIAYRHGFRTSELIALKWNDFDFKKGRVHVERLKKGAPSTHPLRGPELRALSAWERKQGGGSPYVFTALGGAPMTRRTIHHVVAEVGKAAGIEFPVHPHMLRHATGYYLANTGQDIRAIQDYLGHKAIQHTVRYTKLSDERFKDFWRD